MIILNNFLLILYLEKLLALSRFLKINAFKGVQCTLSQFLEKDADNFQFGLIILLLAELLFPSNLEIVLCFTILRIRKSRLVPH